MSANLANLLSPITLGNTSVKNRIVSTGHHTYLADRQPGEELVEYHRARARGGVGLIITEIVAVQQGSIFNWTLFTNPLAVLAAMFGFVGTMMRAPFDVFLAPQEIPTGPPTEYHSAYLALMQTNRVIFPVAKTIIYVNLFFGGASSWGEFAVKVFALYFVSVLIGVVSPRFRVEQSIRFFLKWGMPVGVLAILVV